MNYNKFLIESYDNYKRLIEEYNDIIKEQFKDNKTRKILKMDNIEQENLTEIIETDEYENLNILEKINRDKKYMYDFQRDNKSNIIRELRILLSDVEEKQKEFMKGFTSKYWSRLTSMYKMTSRTYHIDKKLFIQLIKVIDLQLKSIYNNIFQDSDTFKEDIDIIQPKGGKSNRRRKTNKRR
jgi:hypothetical protein